MLPNFLGIGVQRSATTWLYECLREHPEIFLPEQKELHFFNRNFDKGLDWYKAFFQGVKGEKAIGEITPDYLHNYEALKRIAMIIPKAKLIISLRNPVDRAYSAYKLLSTRVYKDISFDEAFWQKDYIRKVGFYYNHLRRLYELFPEDQILVILYDDILSSPKKILTNMFVFLDVNPNFSPKALTKKYNKILFPNVQNLLVSIGLGGILSFIKNSKCGDLIKKLFFYLENLRTIKHDKKDFTRYIEVYREDILNLQNLIQRDLSSWLKSS